MKPRFPHPTSRPLLVGFLALALVLGGCSKKGSSPGNATSGASSAGGINTSQTVIPAEHADHQDGQAGAFANGEHADHAGHVAGDAAPAAAGAVGSAAGNAKVSGSAPAAGMNAQAPVAGAPAAGTAPGSAQAPSTSGAVAQAPVEKGCFSLTFRHKPTGGHSDNESCARHRNVVTLKHKDINAASVCIRVNGTPVKFEKLKPSAKEPSEFDQFLIGTYAGPHTKIAVRYCLHNDNCGEDCKVPKDEFMAAIGAREDDGGPVGLGNWQEGDAKNEQNAKINAELKRSLASFDESGAADAGAITTFKGWEADEPAPTCGK